MDLFSELISALQSDLTAGSESSIFPEVTIKSAINRGRIKAEGLFRWHKLRDAKTTNTQANIEDYDYPDTWRPNSIWKLVVDDQDYGDPLVFEDYLYEKEESRPAGLDYMWANHGTKYFIYPTPTATGSNNISVWGQKNGEWLTEDDDTTIFSYNMPECNEAIVLEAKAILKAKGDDLKSGEFFSNEAKSILALAWSRNKQDTSRQEKTKPRFEIPDYFARGNRKKTEIGNF